MFSFLKRTVSITTAALTVASTLDDNKIKYTDIVIIGGGIAGASAAYFLTQQSPQLDVTLIERNHIASGASSLSAGTIYCRGYGNYSSILSTFAMDTISLLTQLNKKEYDIEFVQNGALEIATCKSQAEFIYEQYEQAILNQYDVQYICSPQEIQQLEPNLSPKVIAVLHSPKSAHVNPGKATVAIAEEARKYGAKIYEDTAVTNIKCSHSNKDRVYSVTTSKNETFHCEHVIIASGAWCSYLCNSNLYGLNITVPVVPVKGQIWVTEPAPLGILKKVIFISESYLYWKRNSSRDDEYDIPEYCTHNKDNMALVRHTYGRQCVDGGILFGGSRIKCDIDDNEIIKSEIENNIAHVREDILPVIGDYNVSASWCGKMPFAMDGAPIVGELDALGLDGVWLLCGFGPDGITEGPGAAKYVVNRIANGLQDEDEIASVINPCRANCVNIVQ